MRAGTARRVSVPAPLEVVVIPLRTVRYRESSWDRLRQHVGTLVSHESVSEAVLVTITLVLIGVLFACLHHAIQPPTPPTGFPPGIVFLP